MTSTSDLIPDHVHTRAHCWWHPEQARWVCGRATDQPQVDTRDMIVVHTAMLREFRLAPAAVLRASADGSPEAATAVERHLAFCSDLLHHHHEGEDELLWPLLRERLPATAAALLEQVESQHLGIDAALSGVLAARTAWVRERDEARATTLSTALQTLYDLLEAHLELEERAVLPLAANVLTEAEWGAVGAAAAQSMPKSALMLAFGMFAYEGDPDVLRSMLAHAPAVARFVVPRVAPRVYARRARQVYGTSRP